MNSKQKGTLSGVLPMLGLLMMAFIMAFQTLPISQALSEEMSDSYTDLSRITEAKSYGALMYSNNGPKGAEFSLNQKSYGLGQDGGNFTWNQDNIPSLNDISDDLENKTNIYLRNNYRDIPRVRSCNIPEINYSVGISSDFSISKNSEKISINLTSFEGEKSNSDPVQIVCDFPSTNVNIKSDEPKFGNDFEENSFATNHEADANRYHILAKNTQQYFSKLQQELDNNVVENTGYGPWGCSSPTASEKETATKNALNNIENAIDSAKTTANNTIQPLPDGINKTSYITSSTTFNYGNPVTTNKMNAKISTNTDTESNKCGASNDHPRYRAEAVITPQNTNITWNINDTKYNVLTENGWESLEFKVMPYKHSYSLP